MEGKRFDRLTKTLAVKTSRRRALKAVAGGAGGSGSTARFMERIPAATRPALDAVGEAGRRLAAVVEHQQAPLPTVHLPPEADEAVGERGAR